jgi:hypothetical protein
MGIVQVKFFGQQDKVEEMVDICAGQPPNFGLSFEFCGPCFLLNKPGPSLSIGASAEHHHRIRSTSTPYLVLN